MKHRIFTIASFFVFIVFPIKSQDYLKGREFERFFTHVEKMPQSLKNDPSKIVEYLKIPTRNNYELVEIIYYWIANNISYDVDGYMNQEYNAVDGLTVLETRTSVCEGYASLFKLLCDCAHIECEIINGYGKGYSYDGKRAEKPNHAWNVVRLDSQWKLIDVTWGSGYVKMSNDTLVYRKLLNLRYLFTKPEGFIIEHFPADPGWQLLKSPITIDEFYSKAFDDKIKDIYLYLY